MYEIFLISWIKRKSCNCFILLLIRVCLSLKTGFRIRLILTCLYRYGSTWKVNKILDFEVGNLSSTLLTIGIRTTYCQICAIEQENICFFNWRIQISGLKGKDVFVCVWRGTTWQKRFYNRETILFIKISPLA